MSAGKAPLGRGLSVLFEQATRSTATQARDQASAAGTVMTLPVRRLQPGQYQPRTAFTADSLEELTQSIRQQGVLQPLLVRPLPDQPERYEIIAGERRWRAAQAAGLTEVPVLIREVADVVALKLALIENLQREDLNPIDEAMGYRALSRDFGLKQEEIAQLIGKSRVHVTNLTRILQLPEPVLEMVRRGELSAGHARALLGAENPLALAEFARAEAWSVRQLERRVMAARPAPEPRPAEASGAEPADPAPLRLDPPEPRADGSGTKPGPGRVQPAMEIDAATAQELAIIERELGGAIAMPVAIRWTREGGSLTIRFQALEQLDSLIQRLAGS